MKRCNVCQKLKPETEFYKRARSRDGLNETCKVCRLKQAKNRRQRMKEYEAALSADARKDADLQRHYKMTLADFESQLAAQAGTCAICGRPPEEFKRSFAVDHNHLTGRVRGILCPDCNRGLGGFHDSIDLLKSAVEYLAKEPSES